MPGVYLDNIENRYRDSISRIAPFDRSSGAKFDENSSTSTNRNWAPFLFLRAVSYRLSCTTLFRWKVVPARTCLSKTIRVVYPLQCRTQSCFKSSLWNSLDTHNFALTGTTFPLRARKPLSRLRAPEIPSQCKSGLEGFRRTTFRFRSFRQRPSRPVPRTTLRYSYKSPFSASWFPLLRVRFTKIPFPVSFRMAQPAGT